MVGITNLVLFVSFLLKAGLSKTTDVTVNCEAGTFIGFREEVDLEGRNVTMSKFLGIPYAEPPVGDLRFRKPVTKTPLREPYKTQKFGSACLQLYSILPPMDHSSESEDCLFLNIFKPEIKSEDDKMAVMVWIHGGAFVFGSSDSYIGDALAAIGPVIVVTINYRLTVWGYLSTGDSNAPGNYGLWDQQLAITWVHQNIEAFGGNPNKVTVFGESAGSASAIFQGLFPGNKGLFQRIIAQSGTPAAPWAIRSNPISDAKHMASLVECDIDDVANMIDCLRNTHLQKLNSSLKDLQNWNMQFLGPFVPVVDGEFVPVSPSESFDINNKISSDIRQKFASYDLIIGLNSGEGAITINPRFGISTEPENFLPNKSFFDQSLVPFLVSMFYGQDSLSILKELIVAEYTDWNDPDNPDSIRQMVCEMYGDLMGSGDMYRAIEAHADMSNQRSYMYYLNVLPYKSVFPRPSWFDKPQHLDDLLYVFGNKIDMKLPGMFEKRQFQYWEKSAAENIMTLWTNFAKTGNPNQPRDIGVDWLPYTPARHRYLEILNDVTASKVKERLNEKRAKFWDTIVPAIARLGRCEKPAVDDTCSRDECSP